MKPILLFLMVLISGSVLFFQSNSSWAKDRRAFDYLCVRHTQHSYEKYDRMVVSLVDKNVFISHYEQHLTGTMDPFTVVPYKSDLMNYRGVENFVYLLISKSMLQGFPGKIEFQVKSVQLPQYTLKCERLRYFIE